jgi:glycosyltransferase involved in cell wall biosynthesis
VVDVIIPAHNHAGVLAPTLAAIPLGVARSVVVVDNASGDGTASVARDAGAVVLREPRLGYGMACQRAVAHLEALPRPPDAVVFMAPDGSDDPRDIPALVSPIRADNAELVIGVRRGKPAHTAQNRVVLGFIEAVYRHRFDDLGPFRAIRFPALIALSLSDRTEAIHVEMQVKAIKFGLHLAEVIVHTPHGPARKESLKNAGKALFHILRHSTHR